MNEQQITNNDEGISILDIIKLIFKRKLVLGITTGVIFLVCFLGIMLIYNKIAPSYESKFEYAYPTFSESKYLDGSSFDYRDLITLDSLEIVKKSSDDFASIDVEKMYENDEISISYVDNTKENSIEKEISYTISVEKKYFNNDKQAKAFITALSKIPVNRNYVISEIISYDNYLKLYDSSNIYENKVEMLEKQYEQLIEKYDELITLFDDVVLEDGKLISYYQNELEVYFNNNSLKSLYDEISLNGYVMENDAYINELMIKKNTLLYQKNVNQLKLNEFEDRIANIINSTSSNSVVLVESYTQEIVKLVNESYEIDSQISAIDDKLNSTADSTLFDSKLTTYRNKLDEFAKQLSKVEKELVNTNSNVYYQYNSVIKTIGSINIIVAGLGSLFIGFMIASIVNICLGYSALNKKKEEEQ